MNIYEEVSKEYDKQIEELKNLLAYGTASSYADYKQIVGRIEGIELSKDNLINIVKTRIYSEEE
jgi:hypothetical protein|tara:strand:+ start:3750 stop:3941 length:192 start_codon:yes stop_codon:yes gene_type:complete